MCTCPVSLGHTLHRWPCPLAGDVTPPEKPEED